MIKVMDGIFLMYILALVFGEMLSGENEKKYEL